MDVYSPISIHVIRRCSLRLFHFPKLPALLDSIIDAWLDAPVNLVASHLNCHLGYVYDYVD